MSQTALEPARPDTLATFDPTVSALLGVLFEDFLKDQRSKNTAAAYRYSLRDFSRFLDELSVREEEERPRTPDKITRTHVRRWKARLLDRGMAPKSVNLRLTAVASFFEWLDDELDDLRKRGMLPPSMAAVEEIRNPARKVKRLPATSTPRRISFDVFAALVKHLESDPPEMRSDTAARDLAILEVFHATGARRSEVLGLRARDVVYDSGRAYDEDERSPYSLEMVVKGGRSELVELPLLVVERIDRYLARVGRGTLRDLSRTDPDGYLFRTSTGRRLAPEAFVRQCKAHAKRCGHRPEDFVLHGIRSLVAVGCADNGSIEDARQQLGHASVSTTGNYIDRMNGRPCLHFEARRAKLQRAIDTMSEGASHVA